MSYTRITVRLRPDVVWTDNRSNGLSRGTIAETYNSSEPLPSQQEYDAERLIMEQEDIDKLTQYNSKQADASSKLAEMAAMSHSELDIYLANFTEAKKKKLFHVVLALLKKLNFSE